MLYLNTKRMFKLRGIEKPNKFLIQNGFTYATAYNILHYSLSNLSYRSMEKLCVALSCTPNDLLEFKPDTDSSIPENHPLNKLKPIQPFSLFEITKDIPVDKIPELLSGIDELKSKLKQ